MRTHSSDGKNPLRVPQESVQLVRTFTRMQKRLQRGEPLTTYNDYIVEIDNGSATAVCAYRVKPNCCYKHGNELGYDDGGLCLGEFKPPMPNPGTSYYTITHCSSTQEAIDRAVRIHRTEHALRTAEVTTIEDLAKLDPREAYQEEQTAGTLF